MADKNKQVIAIAIVGALSDAIKASINELLKDQKGVLVIEGAEIEKEKDRLLSENNNLKIQFDDVVKQRDELESLKNGHIEEIGKLNEQIVQLSNELVNLSTELDSAQKSADAGYVTVKSGKKIYRVLGKKFSYNNREYTAEQLVKNPKLVDELVEIGSGILIEVKGDKK